ncbi:DUF6254 family protein [Ectobacillus sp. sgz5001026]
MADQKREAQRQWKSRKENQQPHGKVKSFAELTDNEKSNERKQ